MNWTLLAAGTLLTLLAIGHLAGGMPMILRPMLQSDTPSLPKAVNHSVFHMISAWLFLAGGAYLAVASGWIGPQPGLVAFISVCCVSFGAVQLLIGTISDLQRGWLQIWQWMVFAGVGALGFLGLP